MPTIDEKPRRLEPKRKTAGRFNVSVRTIDRWVDAGILDQPTRINGRDYFEETAQPKASAGQAA